ncbi:hypothetical protein SteCoe_31574 [Stentor coeruleus]|uniref:Uncharacterized protein n=1 Tax=Stentor coeruleus TaxID=5963 RepID=A0A1R2B0Y3_9CILI|nr:hypothetical protein SteCoe_31574 [Stentor coeruleus]
MKTTNDKSLLYKETLLESSGLNIQISEGLYLSDLLRIDFDYELRQEAILGYLKNTLPAEFTVSFTNICSANDYKIIILPDWGVYFSKPQLKVAFNASADGFFSFFHEAEGPKSYVVLSFITRLVSINNLLFLPQALKEVTDPLNIIRIKSHIAGFIYSTSKYDTKNLITKCIEAKELLCTESYYSEDSIVNHANQIPMAKKIISVKLFQDGDKGKNSIQGDIDEYTSFEYSMSEDTSHKINVTVNNTDGTLPKKVNEFESSTGINAYRRGSGSLASGIESPRFTFLECSQEIITPLASPRLFDYPSNEICLIAKLHDAKGNVSNSYDSEKINRIGGDGFGLSNKTSCSETPLKSEEKIIKHFLFHT